MNVSTTRGSNILMNNAFLHNHLLFVTVSLPSGKQPVCILPCRQHGDCRRSRYHLHGPETTGADAKNGYQCASWEKLEIGIQAEQRVIGNAERKLRYRL